MKIFSKDENLHLEHLNCRLSSAIDKTDINFSNLDFSSRVEMEGERLVLELHARFLSKPVLTAILTTRVPENWVEAVKDRFLPRFARKYWPIKYSEIMTSIRTHNVCPHLPTDTSRKHVDWLVNNVT